MKVLGMSNLEDEPTLMDLPHNIKTSHLKTRETHVNRILSAILEPMLERFKQPAPPQPIQLQVS